MREVPCSACAGSRLKPLTLAVTIEGKSIADIASLPIGEAVEVLSRLALSDRESVIASRVLKEVNERLQFLVDVGLHYLSMDRACRHPGGG